MTKPLDPIEATTATHAAKPGPQAPSSPATCANCGAVLAGEYCHECGQYAHNPLSSFRHAVEDVFESVWHLDGRIFRTLRNLFVPGLVAREYLSGHRVRYIPPLRLFVILSLLTFFVGRLVLHVDFNPGIRVGGEMISFDSDRSVAAVEQRRDRLLGKLREQEIAAARTPGASPTLIAARTRIQGESAARIAQLRGKTAAARASGTGTAAPDAATPATTGGRDRPPAAGDARGEGEADSPFDCEKLRSEAQDRQWMPGFADRWINARVIRGCENFKQADTQGERLFQAFLAAVPTVLFLLMPVFALLLKLLHLGSGRTYLEHLVVALYSHAFLLLMLLALFVLSTLDRTGAPGWVAGIGYAAVWIGIPVYLWLMQRRVYGGRWWSNALRFMVTGIVYFVMVVTATVSAALIGVSS